MIQGIIDKAIADARAEKTANRVSSGKFNVSDAGKCQLMRYWKRQGKIAETEPDERAFRIFEIGHIFEKWVISMINTKTAPITYQEQILVEDEHRKGFADLMLFTLEQTILYDIKTVHSRKFWNNEREGWDKADLHYKCQLLTYNKMLPAPCNSLRLLYISKDDLCMAEIAVTGNEGLPEVYKEGYENIKEFCSYDWDYLIQCWVDKTEPIANPQSWECKYCGYANSCKSKIVKEPKKKKEKEGYINAQGKSTENKSQ